MNKEVNMNTPTVEDVRSYWNTNPLFSHEVDMTNLDDFFKEFDRIKVQDVERYAMPYWEFEKSKGLKVADIGCGPGWITVNYAKNGADIHSVDLTPKAVELTKKHLNYYNLQGNVQVGNAEELPFEDEYFDLVVSSGVLHHTPDTQKAINESYRVLKKGGRAKLTFYHRGILHSKVGFGFTKMIMKILGVGHPGAKKMMDADTIDDFIRQYDGEANPVGIGKTTQGWIESLEQAGYTVEGHELHFFPARFLPFTVPGLVHKVLDNYFGTMIYFNLKKN